MLASEPPAVARSRIRKPVPGNRWLLRDLGLPTKPLPGLLSLGKIPDLIESLPDPWIDGEYGSTSPVRIGMASVPSADPSLRTSTPRICVSRTSGRS